MGKNWKGLRPTHPGELLREELMPAIGWTQEALAGRLGVSRRTINGILREKRPVSADMAHRLARLFDTTPEFWLGLQQAVDLWNARQAADGEYLKIKPLGKSA
jgi:addiction module HigA family antidote